ncbi:MAG TPA: 2Fe-2S iron-sulfur cluster-binding protein [Steroidobacteraceae bacterium]|nr:2Fe-2S iron-sulfur cluster-binding protein [Steroidobacteraceae bacterium]
MRVSLTKSERRFSAAADQSLLDAAIAAGLALAHSCRSGNCGACRATLLQGEVTYPYGPPLGLSADEIGAGKVLLCQARARTDLELDIDEIRRPEEVVVKRLPCRIEHAQRLAHDVIALYLRLPSAEEFAFQPGQYLDVILPGGRRRSFSIASPPHDARLVELHVRHVAGGEFTDRLFAADPAKILLTIEGPLGDFRYHPPRLDAAGAGRRASGGAAAPMLLVAGGTGYAPINAILRHLVDQGSERDLWLYFGVRAERDLYADARIREIAARAPRLRYVPVLCEPSADWRGRRGLVHEAVLAEHPRLEAFDVYACGPPAMIQAVRRDFAACGADPARLYFDSFDYAPDSVARQRNSASSKS